MELQEHEIRDKQLLSADVCIVGGGPSAITLALQFADTSLKVVMLPGGSWNQKYADRDLYRGIVMPNGSHEPLEMMRRRQFGGGSAVWAGRCVPFDPIDFRSREWVDQSGWPVTYEEMVPYLHKACNICQIGAFKFNAHELFPNSPKEIIPGLDHADLVSYCLERYSAPINFAQYYRSILNSSSNIKVLIDAHALKINVSDDGQHVRSVTCAIEDKRMTVYAGCVVVASGAIENARLLLVSTSKFHPTGLGNHHDNVGRYYMTHITGTYAKVAPKNKDLILFDFELDADQVFCRRRWWVPDHAQQEKKLLNMIFYLSHPVSLNIDRSLVFSTIYDSMKFMVECSGLRAYLRRVVKKQRYPIVLKPLINLGMPAILPSRSSKYWGVFFSSEQSPNRDSRIKLSISQKDAFGIERVEMHYKINEVDLESIVACHEIFVNRYKKMGLGDIVYTQQGLREYLTKKVKNYNSYAHHIGTTRMSIDPRSGVVDKNAKVWGISNLYIAGASTFPTAGHANPTIMVVAQSVKLAKYLIGVLSLHTTNSTNLDFQESPI